MLGFKGAIFDMDGTILDSMSLWKDIDVDFLNKRGFEVPSDYMSAIAHLGAMDTALYTINRFSLSDTPEALIDEWQTLAKEKYKTVSEKPGILEYLRYLKKNNIKTAVATATCMDLIKAAMNGREISEYIDIYTSVDEVKKGKGFPDIYLKCCERLKLSAKDCIVFEDIVMGIKGAKKGNFKTVAIYDECSKADEPVLRSLADRYIYDFRELIAD